MSCLSGNRHAYTDSAHIPGQMHFSGTIVLLLAAVFGVWFYAQRDQTESPRSSWKRIGAGGQSSAFVFSFAAPQDIYEGEVQGIDSEVGAFRNQRIIMSYDLGPYSSDLSEHSEEEGCHKTNVEIDGKQGTLVISEKRSPYYAGIAFRDVHGKGFHLTMSAESLYRKAHKVAVEILKSIRFEN